MASGDPTGYNFLIRELTGNKRVVTLRGRALPYQPLRNKVGQRREKTWLPGVAEATMTVLGPEEFPTTINGFWKDKYIGDPANQYMSLNGTAVTSVEAAINLFDDLARAGQNLEVTWFSVKRQGLLAEFESSWHNAHDCEWSMNFDWIGRGEKLGAPVFISTSNAGDNAAQFARASFDLSDISLNLPLSLTVFGPIISAFTTLQDDMEQMQSIASNLAALAASPANAFKTIVSICSDIVNDATSTIQLLQSTIAQNYSAVPYAQQSPTDVFVVEAFRRSALDQCRVIRGLALTQRDAFLDQLLGELQGQYTARQGDDCRKVSQSYYNTPNEWRRIMLFNDLSDSSLTPGQLVLVPKINPQDTQQSYGSA